jgi:LacI family transcriptional regulator, repressor for deo operon, udp, cdd, tsx, nupC, and nupG
LAAGTAHKPPTIRDVARHAKVSAATVSRVLSAPERVSSATRERVLKSVLDTGYTVNEAARSLRRQRAKTLLAAVPGLDNTYYSTVLDAVIAVALERGYGVLVTCRLDDDPVPRLSEYIHSNRADGLLIFDGMLQTRKLHRLFADGRSVPLVAAYDELPDPQIHSVITDNLESAERAVEHLVSYGHQRIGHVAGLSRNTFPNERLVGFRKAMFEHRLGVREEWIFQGDYTMEGGLAAAEHFASLKDRPTAIFSANDDMAFGLIAGLRKAGIECPRDISIIGFDDISIARTFSPALTTMHQPRTEIGRLATETLINLIEGNLASATPVRLVMRSQLIVRDSTRRLKA